MNFELGDYVEVELRPDGSVFSGVLMFFNDDYVVLNGYGYPHETIAEMRHA